MKLINESDLLTKKEKFVYCSIALVRALCIITDMFLFGIIPLLTVGSALLVSQIIVQASVWFLRELSKVITFEQTANLWDIYEGIFNKIYKMYK